MTIETSFFNEKYLITCSSFEKWKLIYCRHLIGAIGGVDN